jgi:hypothetical protein
VRKVETESASFLYEQDREPSEMHASLLLCSVLLKSMLIVHFGSPTGTDGVRGGPTCRT